MTLISIQFFWPVQYATGSVLWTGYHPGPVKPHSSDGASFNKVATHLDLARCPWRSSRCQQGCSGGGRDGGCRWSQQRHPEVEGRTVRLTAAARSSWSSQAERGCRRPLSSTKTASSTSENGKATEVRLKNRNTSEKIHPFEASNNLIFLSLT